MSDTGSRNTAHAKGQRAQKQHQVGTNRTALGFKMITLKYFRDNPKTFHLISKSGNCPTGVCNEKNRITGKDNIGINP